MRLRVLVTGAQGFLGRWLLQALDQSGQVDQLVGLGRSPRSELHFTHRLRWRGCDVAAPLPAVLRESPRRPVSYQQMDVCDGAALRALIGRLRPHWIFHLASGLRDDAAAALCRSNVEGTTVLTQAVIDSGWRPRRIVFGSSGSVYGLPARLPIHEDDRTKPCNLYGATKLAAETTSRLLCAAHSLPAVWARLFNLVGPGQDERHACGRFAGSLASLRTVAGAPSLSVGNLGATRDFIDVRDAAQALLLLARSAEIAEICNVASGTETEVGQVLAHLSRLAGLDGRLRVHEAPPSPGEVPRHVADISRLRALGFRPRHMLAASLDDLWAYYAGCVADVADTQAAELGATQAAAGAGVRPPPAEHALEPIRP